jgi:predicted nucleic acid-binding protein
MIFVDTGFFVALLCVNDAHHESAKQALQAYQGLNLRGALLTTNNVVLETLTVVRREAGHAVAVRAGELLFSGKLASVHRTTEEDELAAFDYMRQHSDKRYSAIDCLSFVVMLKLGIEEALTFDRRDFSHRFIVKPDIG